MKFLTNCKNCGAPLHYDDGSSTICKYCNTEYHYDEIKKEKPKKEENIKAYNFGDFVELELYGKKKKFYISEVEMHPICTCSYISPDDRFKTEDWEYKCALRLIEV